MAMTGLPDDEGAEGSGGAIFSDINITPLTDIFLVLLIIFMVTTTAIAEAGGQNGGIKVQLPKGGQANALKEVHDLAIAVLADGRTSGTVTSGAPSPTLGVPIAMAYLEPAADEGDPALSVGIRGEAVPAHLTDMPFYRRRQ